MLKLCKCVIRSSKTCTRLEKKCEYAMLEALSGKFKVILRDNVRSIMLHANAATLRELTYFILWLI